MAVGGLRGRDDFVMRHPQIALDQEAVVIGIEHRALEILTGERADRLER